MSADTKAEGKTLTVLQETVFMKAIS